MKRLWASMIIVTMMLTIFSLSPQRVLRAETGNEQALINMIKWNLLGEDELGCPMEDWREVPWQTTPDTIWWGREGYLMPNAQRAKHSTFIGRNIPATPQNGFFTRPVMWARFFMDITASGGISQGRDVWYVILDDAGQVWFDPDGFFHDPRYDETADPGNPGEVSGLPTDVYQGGSCLNNPLMRVDPFEGNNTQGPYIFDPFYRYNLRDPQPAYRPNIFFWDNRPGTGSGRTWKLGWASFTDYQNNTRVSSGDWDTELPLVPFRSDEMYVDLDYTFENMPRVLEWGRTTFMRDNKISSMSSFKNGEFVQFYGSINYIDKTGSVDLLASKTDSQFYKHYIDGFTICSDDQILSGIIQNINTNNHTFDFVFRHENDEVIIRVSYTENTQYNEYNTIKGKYDYGEFIYRKGSNNTSFQVQVGDIRLTPVVCYDSMSHTNITYEPETVVLGNDLDFIAGYELNAFGPEIRHSNRGPNPGFFHHENFIYAKGHRYDENDIRIENTAFMVEEGDIRLTPVDKNTSIHGFLSNKNQWWGGLWKNDVLIMTELLEGGCNAPAYDIHVQSDAWMGVNPSETSARLRSPSESLHLPSQNLQKNTTLVPNQAKYPMPVTTFHNVKLNNSEFLGVELWNDNGVNNVFMTSLNLSNRLHPNNLSDDFVEAQQAEHYIGSENLGLDLDYDRQLLGFSPEYRFHDAVGNREMGTDDPIYKKAFGNYNLNQVEAGDTRSSDMKYDFMGQRFEFKKNTTVRPGDPDLGLNLNKIPSNILYYPSSLHAFAASYELIEYNAGDDIYALPSVNYLPDSIIIRALGDAWQYLYADVDNNGRVSPGDIRIFSSLPTYSDGSVVQDGDADVNLFYRTLPSGLTNIVPIGIDENLQFAYADINESGSVDPGDIRLTQAMNYRPGSVVHENDTDYLSHNPPPLHKDLDASYNVRRTASNELYIDIVNDGNFDVDDVAIIPVLVQSGIVRLTNVKINDIEYAHGTRVSAGNIFYRQTRVHMIPVGMNGDRRFVDMAVLPADLGLDIRLSNELTVERTTQIDIQVSPPPKVGELIYVYVYEPDSQETSHSLVTATTISASRPKFTFQYTSWKGSVGFSGQALERYFRIEAFKVSQPMMGYETATGKSSIIKPSVGRYEDPFWATQKVIRGPIHFDAQRRYNTPIILPRIQRYHPNYHAFHDGYECYEEWKDIILPARVNMLPNKKALTLYEERQPVMEIQVFTGDDPLDVNDPSGLPFSTSTAIDEDVAFAYYNVHGAGIAYVFTTYLSHIVDRIVAPQWPDPIRNLEGWEKAIVQVNTDNTFHAWLWVDQGHIGRLDGPDQLIYQGRGTGVFVDRDCSRGSGKYDLDTGSTQRPPPLGDITRMDTFAGAPIIHYGVPVKLTNFYENDVGGRFLVAAKPRDNATPMNVVFYSHQMMYDYNLSLAYPRYGGHQFYGPYFTNDLSNGIDYIGSVQITVCEPDPVLNFVDVTWLDHALQYSTVNYTAGSNALSPMTSPPAPFIRSRYNPILFDLQDDIRSYPGGQTHTGRVIGTSGTTDTGRGSGWNAYPAIWSKNTARRLHGHNYDEALDFKYNQYNKLGTEFYPLTDYAMFFRLKNFDNLNYTFETTPPNALALEEHRLLINRITIRGPFMRPRSFYDLESNTISYTLPNQYGDLSRVPVQYDYSGEIVITDRNYQLFEQVLGNFTSVTSPPTSELFIGSETTVYSENNPVRYTPEQTNPLLVYNRAVDFSNAAPEQMTYDNPIMNVFAIDEIIPIGRGRITIEVELENGIVRQFEDCCTGDYHEGGFLVHGLDIETNAHTFEPDMDHKLEVKIMEYEPKGFDPRYTETVHECNNAVMVVWQDRGIRDASGRLIGAGDGWITRPPVNSLTTSNAYQYSREHDINGDGKISFADYETEIMGTYDMATNTWSGGLIDARTYSRNNGLYTMDLSHTNGNQVTTVGYDFGGGERIGRYTTLDHIVDRNEMLPIMVTAYKYGDDNNDRAFTPLYDYYEPGQYSHEVYLSGQTVIDVVPSQSLNVTTSPEVLTAGTQAELNDPQNPLTFIVLDEEGNPVDLSQGGIPDAAGFSHINDDAIWNSLILDPHPDNRDFYGNDAQLPQYYWVRTDLHNTDNSFVNNRRLYSNSQNPFYPIEIDFRDKANGRYIFNGFVANDQGSFDVFVFTPDRKRFGKVAVQVDLPQVSYEVTNTDDPRGQVFTSPGDPDFVLTAGDNRLYRVTAQVKSATGVPLRGAGSDISVCGGSANETARFTLLSDAPNNFGWRTPLLNWFTNSAIPNRTYDMIAGKTAGFSAIAHIRAGFDYNNNGQLDEMNQEIFELGGFRAFQYDHRVATGSRYNDYNGATYTYYNTRSWMWENGEFLTYPLHFILPEEVIKQYEGIVYPNISFEKGMGLGAIYNSPHLGGYTFADLDGDGLLTYHDSFNLDNEGKVTFYLFAEDIASVGGLIGNNRYSINDAFNDVAGNSAAYSSGVNPQRMEGRYFNNLLFRVVVAIPPHMEWLMELYRQYCELYGGWYCEYYQQLLDMYTIVETSHENTGDNTFRLDWDALPSHYLELRAPSVDIYDAQTNIAIGKDILSPDAYDIAYGKTTSLLIRAYPADRGDLPLQVGASFVLDQEEFFPRSEIIHYGPQAESNIFGNLYKSEADPRARETIISFTPTGTGSRQAFLQYWNHNTRFSYPAAYMAGGAAAFDIAQGLEIKVFENEPLKARTPGRITVLVTEAGTTRPVRGARVTVEGLGVSDSKTADSNGSAEFSLTPNNRGVLVIKASMESMITATHLQGVDEDATPQTIDLDPVDILHDTNTAIISGRVKSGSVVTINTQPVSVNEQGRFRYEARLEHQNNMFEIVAKDSSGRIARRIVNIERQTDELQIRMEVPDRFVDAKEASIRGRVMRTRLSEEAPNRLIWIFVNGVEAQAVPDERHIEFTFEATIPLDYGRNRIEVNVRTAEGFTKKVTEVNNYRKSTIELQIDNDKAVINGEYKTIDGKPYISGGRTFVPLRVVAEGFGAEVTWVQQTRGINITLGEQVISMQIGSTRAMVNNEIVHMDAPPEITNGRTYVPIRFVSEMLGAEVQWIQSTRTVIIERLTLD